MYFSAKNIPSLYHPQSQNYNLRLLMIVCISLIWFLLTFSRNQTTSMLYSKLEEKQDGIHSQGPTPPQHFLYLRETKSWWCEGEGGEEKVSMLTHATTRGVGNNNKK